MAKKTVTEVVEIERGAIIRALQLAGYPISGGEKVEALNASGGNTREIGTFDGLSFTAKYDAQIVPKAEK